MEGGLVEGVVVIWDQRLFMFMNARDDVILPSISSSAVIES